MVDQPSRCNEGCHVYDSASQLGDYYAILTSGGGLLLKAAVARVRNVPITDVLQGRSALQSQRIPSSVRLACRSSNTLAKAHTFQGFFYLGDNSF
jgi:hypothetical protein